MPRFSQREHPNERTVRDSPAMSVSQPASQHASKPPFADEKYINLETFKKDGTGVKTPVWAAPMDGALYVFSAGNAWKVKRIRNNGKARAAACDARGNVHGEWVDGSARVIDDPATIDRIIGAMKQKYGLVFNEFDFFAAIAGRKKKRAYLEIKLG